MARGFDDLHKVFIVQRSGRTSENGDSGRYSNGSVMSLSSSSEQESESSSLGEPSSLVEHKARRYKDVCYGSPFRKVRLPDFFGYKMELFSFQNNLKELDPKQSQRSRSIL